MDIQDRICPQPHRARLIHALRLPLPISYLYPSHLLMRELTTKLWRPNRHSRFRGNPGPMAVGGVLSPLAQRIPAKAGMTGWFSDLFTHQ